MNKKFLSLVLALVMVLGTFGSVFAAEAPKADAKKDTKVEETKKVPEKKDNNEKVQWLVDNEVVLGRKMYKDEKNNDLALDKNIQRAEITKLLVYAIGRQDLATKIHGQVKPYSDVKNDHWANGFITVGTTMASPKNALPFLHGYVDGSFKPENDVTYVELAKMLVVLVKDDLTQADFKTAVWPRDWMAWAAKLGILDGVKVEDSSKAAVRQDAFVMLYNALYKLGELRNLPAHETMGIISAADANKITLNQGDFKKEFTVNSSTNFVPANYSRDAKSEITFWANVVKGNETYYIGSLVRVLADDKGNVTHIVQLGNPTELAIAGAGWTAVAQNTIETVNDKVILGFDKTKLDTLTFTKAQVNDKVDAAKHAVLENATLKVNSATRYFVADYAKRQLTEVKDANAAIALLNRTNNSVEKVYAGYDVLPNSKINEAKVVVFGVVDKSAIQEDLVRVVTPMNNKYELTAQEPGQTAPAEKTFDLRNYKAAFPLNANREKYDVINLSADQSDVVIDHSEDNIYKVVDIKTEEIQNIKKVGGRSIVMELMDEYNYKTKVDIVADADLFFGDQIKEGANVQVRFYGNEKAADPATKPAVDIISVVPDKDLRGALPNNLDAQHKDQVTGIVYSVAKRTSGDYSEVTLSVPGHPERAGVTYKVVNEVANDLDKGDVVTFIKAKVGNVVEANAIKVVKAADVSGLKNLTAAEKAAAEKAFNDAVAAGEADKAVKAAEEAKALDAKNKAAAEKALADAKKLLEEAKADKAKAIKAENAAANALTKEEVKAAVEKVAKDVKVTVAADATQGTGKEYTADVTIEVTVDGAAKTETVQAVNFLATK